MDNIERDSLQNQQSAFEENIFSRNEPDDFQLVALSKQGDQDAFALLVRRHQRRIFLLSFRMLHDADDANEVTQEAFLAAWQGLSTFRGDALFHNWLYRITYNYCLRVIESRKRKQILQEALLLEQFPLETKNVQQLELIAELHEQQALVREHLKHLPTMYSVVLILRHLQERTYEEMSDILMLPIGTIKTHLFRARKLLKERIRAHINGMSA